MKSTVVESETTPFVTCIPLPCHASVIKDYSNLVPDKSSKVIDFTEWICPQGVAGGDLWAI